MCDGHSVRPEMRLALTAINSLERLRRWTRVIYEARDLWMLIYLLIKSGLWVVVVAVCSCHIFTQQQYYHHLHICTRIVGICVCFAWQIHPNNIQLSISMARWNNWNRFNASRHIMVYSAHIYSSAIVAYFTHISKENKFIWNIQLLLLLRTYNNRRALLIVIIHVYRLFHHHHQSENFE